METGLDKVFGCDGCGKGIILSLGSLDFCAGGALCGGYERSSLKVRYEQSEKERVKGYDGRRWHKSSGGGADGLRPKEPVRWDGV